jgi:hypothetical protein
MSLHESIEKVKHLFKGIMDGLSGGEKRRAAAEIAEAYGRGGQTYVAREFQMGRNTLRKGKREIEGGEAIEDKFNLRGRKKKTEELPELEAHIRAILDSQSQADPKFQTDRLYTNMSIGELRRQLMKQYGYADEVLPTARTLNTIANSMGYTVKTVRKSKPLKKIVETDLIFYNLERIHERSAGDDDVVRLSIDTKDRVKVGEFSRGGKSRIAVNAYDHDFGDTYMIPFGIMNVKTKDVEISISETKVTADFMVDRIEEYWIANGYSGTGKTLLLNSDNGPENNSNRTQFIKRMVEFSINHNTEVILAYYPPYHSKYNPVERVWGVLEQHWNGGLLDTEKAVEEYIKTMTYDGRHPIVKVIDKIYETGVKVGKEVMGTYNKALDRIAGIEKWFVRISLQKSMDALATMECL